MAKSPTVEDVALRAGVSRQTVSNVLNTPDIVRPSTRERVHAAIDELGYRPLAAARNLRTRRSSTIGIHLDPYAGGVSGVVLDRFVHALTEHAGARGMRVLVYAARTAEEEIERLTDLSDSGEVDAAIITGTFHGDPRTQWLIEHGLPFVSFGRPWGEDDVSSPAHLWVDVDGAAGTAQATAHALAQAGPRVAFLGWPHGSGTGDDRERGWMLAGGSGAGVRLTAEDDAQQAKTAASAVIGDVDAIVCASDLLAIGAHLAAADSGRSGLPIYGFDNTPAAEALGISSIEQLPEQVAAGALELLMGPTGNAVAPRRADAGTAHVLVEPRLIVR